MATTPTLFDEITDELDVEGEDQARRWNAGSARVRDISEQHFRPGRRSLGNDDTVPRVRRTRLPPDPTP
jgi:hypothetical protein